MTEERADIGVFGGSGFYSLLEDVREIKIETPFGPPSDLIALGNVEGKRIAFLPRHGRRHEYPPHTIPYKANIWAMKELGVTRIIAPSAVGSLQTHVKPGDFMVCDQFVDRTSGRGDTFYNGPITTHISAAEPFCAELRELAVSIIRKQGLPVHDGGTTVVIQGPRFSTKAESKWFTSMGWGIINMTQYPEVILALEQEMCYVNIALVTDYDAGLVGAEGARPVTAEEVEKMFISNIERVKGVIFDMIERTPLKRACACSQILRHARLS
ncbi:MAG: S-methyl-5'-thioadenosine phosphorylase [Armatimonadota bacterium]|nr:S-methyl-5'-thioadenosine phosphorylase [Armatimonadota bacterium]